MNQGKKNLERLEAWTRSYESKKTKKNVTSDSSNLSHKKKKKNIFPGLLTELLYLVE